MSREQSSQYPNSSLPIQNQSACGLTSKVYVAHLKSVELGIHVKTQTFTPLPSPLILLIKPHNEQRVQRIDDGIANTARGSEVRTGLGQRMKLATSVTSCQVSPSVTSSSPKACFSYADQLHSNASRIVSRFSTSATNRRPPTGDKGISPGWKLPNRLLAC